VHFNAQSSLGGLELEAKARHQSWILLARQFGHPRHEQK
jgi:hypothetical protein